MQSPSRRIGKMTLIHY